MSLSAKSGLEVSEPKSWTPLRKTGGVALSVLLDENLREQAARMVRAEIISGGIQPGVVFSARGLATRLGVSATPVREAMLDLVKDGLLVPLRNRGFEVVRLEDRDLDEIYQLRMQLEIPNVRQLAGRIGKSDASRLAKIAVEIAACAQREDLTGFLDADRRFHLGLLELVGNVRMLKLVAQLRDQSRLYGLPALLAQGSLAQSASEHTLILESLARDDPDQCDVLMRAHLKHTRGTWAGLPEGDGEATEGLQ